MEFYDFPETVGNNHPNWRTHIFQRGRYTTNQIRCGVYQPYVDHFIERCPPLAFRIQRQPTCSSHSAAWSTLGKTGDDKADHSDSETTKKTVDDRSNKQRISCTSQYVDFRNAMQHVYIIIIYIYIYMYYIISTIYGICTHPVHSAKQMISPHKSTS